jgi:hypothetical protein
MAVSSVDILPNRPSMLVTSKPEHELGVIFEVRVPGGDMG